MTADPTPGTIARRRLRRLAGGLAAVLAVTSGYFTATAILTSGPSYDQIPPPQPTTTGLPPVLSPAALAPAAPLGPSEPVRIDIPRIGIHAGLIEVGQNPDGSVAVPSEDQAAQAAWYTGSATPGQIGPTVILGHVDSRALPRGRAAFYPLGAAHQNDEVDITRQDHTVARFRIDVVTLVGKEQFPTQAVYGPTDTPALRLITCGGTYTTADGYSANIIVFAHYTGSRPAP
jgi:hypothetical protein